VLRDFQGEGRRCECQKTFGAMAGVRVRSESASGEGRGCECRKPTLSCIWSDGEGEGEDMLHAEESKEALASRPGSGFQKPKPGQSPDQAETTARLGPA
jgi:hypothetical protein